MGPSLVSACDTGAHATAMQKPQSCEQHKAQTNRCYVILRARKCGFFLTK